MIYDHIYHSASYHKVSKSNSYTVEFSDKKIGEVLYYVQLHNSTYAFLSHFTELPVIICKDDLTGKLREILQL